MSDLPVVTDDDFDSVVLGSTLPVLVDFFADWCGPCKVLLPALLDVAREYDGEVRIVKLNVDNSPAIRDRFGVRGIPAMLIFYQGEERRRLAGALPRSAIAAAIEAVLESAT